MTAEMLRSDDPCAIALTLTPALPSALKNFPAMPSRSIMPSPTIATMQQLSLQVNRLHFASLYLREERFLDCFLCELGLRTRHGEADRMFRTRLRDHHDRDLDSSQCAEKFMGHAGDADHAGAFDVDESHVFDRGKSFDRNVGW